MKLTFEQLYKEGLSDPEIYDLFNVLKLNYILLTDDNGKFKLKSALKNSRETAYIYGFIIGNGHCDAAYVANPTSSDWCFDNEGLTNSLCRYWTPAEIAEGSLVFLNLLKE